MKTMIKADGVGKKYILTHQRKERYYALRDAIADTAKRWAGNIRHPLASRYVQDARHEEFWALKDICFEIAQGDRVGIIGRNGAGKSTLLKILSRITQPTTGRIDIWGRVASLLEVGTGFHPELTGRENIFLNGAILGMTKAEIRTKFDEIVDFAEVEKFLDTPVKRYSSGMYVRLAFAVAAHLEPEILVVDEVLAVGDSLFQKKCLGKMEQAGKEGRTVLFVSHNMQAITQLCNRALLLENGTIVATDAVSKVIARYLHKDNDAGAIATVQAVIRSLKPDPVFRLESVSLRQDGRPAGQFIENGLPLEIEISYDVFEKVAGLRLFIDICDDQDLLLLRSFHDEDNDGIPFTEPGHYSSVMVVPRNFLGPLAYVLRINAGIFNDRMLLPGQGITIPFKVEQTGQYNRAYLGDTFRGKLSFPMHWTTNGRQ